MQFVNIRYIGKQVNRRDDVLRTSRVWEKAGSIVKVPEADAIAYLNHPGEWDMPSDEVIEQTKQAVSKAALDSLVFAERIAELPDEALNVYSKIIDAERLKRAAAALANHADAVKKLEEAQGALPVGTPVAEEPPIQTDVKDQGSVERLAERIDKLVPLIKDLDPTSPEHYTSKGLPRLELLSERLGAKVTSAELTAAMKRVRGAG